MLTRDRIHWICGQVQGTEILDVGCSGGLTSILLAREGLSVIGIDHQVAMIEEALKLLEQEEEPVRARASFQVAQGASLPAPSAAADTVILAEVVEHLILPERILAECHRVLRPGGTLVLTVPYGRDETPDHKDPVYLRDLVGRLTAAGFAVSSIRSLHHWVGVVAQRDGTPIPDLDRVMLGVAEERLRDVDVELVAAKRDARAERAKRQDLNAEAKELRQRARDAEREAERCRTRAERAEATLAKLRGSRWFRLGSRVLHPFRRTP